MRCARNTAHFLPKPWPTSTEAGKDAVIDIGMAQAPAARHRCDAPASVLSTQPQACPARPVTSRARRGERAAGARAARHRRGRGAGAGGVGTKATRRRA